MFNGYVNQYQLTAPSGWSPADQRVRVWVLDAGPERELFVPRHRDDLRHRVQGRGPISSNPTPAGGGPRRSTSSPHREGFVEFSFDEAGLYPFVTHKFANVGKGALGVFQAGEVSATAGQAAIDRAGQVQPGNRCDGPPRDAVGRPAPTAWSGPLTAPLAGLIPAGGRSGEALTAIKAIHSAIFVSIAAAILVALWDGLRGRPQRRTAVAGGMVVGRDRALVGDEPGLSAHAPGQGAGRRAWLGRRRFFLPAWAARRIPLVAGTAAPPWRWRSTSERVRWAMSAAGRPRQRLAPVDARGAGLASGRHRFRYRLGSGGDPGCARKQPASHPWGRGLAQHAVDAVVVPGADEREEGAGTSA